MWKLIKMINPFKMYFSFGDEGDGDDGSGAGDNSGGDNGDGGNGDTGGSEKIVVPESYKDRGWAKKEFKTHDDLFKEIDELHALKGKKTVPFDYSTATENEIAAHIKSTSPESIDAYEYGVHKDAEGNALKNEAGEEVPIFDNKEKEWIGNTLKDLGISPYKGTKLIAAFEKQKSEVMKEHFSKEGQEAIFKEIFKDSQDWKKDAGDMMRSLKADLSVEDQNFLDKKVPNHTLALIARMHQNTIKAYGAQEGQDRGGSDGSGGESFESVENKRTEIRVKMDAIRGKANSHAQLNKLNEELKATYKTDPRLKK